MGSCWPRGFTTRGDRFALFFPLFEAVFLEEAVDFLEETGDFFTEADFFVVAALLFDGDFLAAVEAVVLADLDLEAAFWLAGDFWR